MTSTMRKLLGRRGGESAEELRDKLNTFRDLVDKNDEVLGLIGDASEKLGGDYVFDSRYLEELAGKLRTAVHGVVDDLNAISHNRYPELFEVLSGIDAAIRGTLECRMTVPDTPYVLSLDEVGTEHLEAVGEKMARLGEMSRRLGCRIPDGFVVTARACREYLDAADIRENVEALRVQFDEGGADIEEKARQLQERVLATPVPRRIARAIRRAVSDIEREGAPDSFAVRSSAVGEDGELSFAGQYETLLGVRAEDVVTAYRKVVASLYSPRVVRYVRRHGVPPHCGLMAVGCLRMVPARTSGVVYSLSPGGVRRNMLMVSATWGLGRTVVEDEAAVDRFDVSRAPGYPVKAASVADKSWRYEVAPGGGLVRRSVAPEERRTPALTEPQVSELAEVACRIEQYMKSAQDIEWAVDDEGRLFILQARPLSLPLGQIPEDVDLSTVVSRYPVLLRDRGEVACRGIGSGRVHLVAEGEKPAGDVPPGAVLVARGATPRLGEALPGASAVLTDLGSATGHFAAVAREFRVPTIVATEVATLTLEEGMEVTVDAEENVVYEGRVDELLQYQLLKRSSFEDVREFRVLRRMLRRIAPLHLGDVQSSGFSAERCRTYHDIIRFAHEKAIVELTGIGWVKPSGADGFLRRLELPIPLDLVLIDLGGGFRSEETRPTVTLSDLTSRPLIPILRELTREDTWQTAPAQMDLNGFLSSATRSMSLTSPLAARPEQNLAIVSDEYLHLSLRLGYHFNIVDTHLGDTPADNYIYFRFAGGVTELTRRSRRAALLKRLLERHGFVVEGHGDLVVGRIKGLAPAAMVEALRMIGRLIGFTRQLDIFLRDDRMVDAYIERFMG